MLQIDIYSDTVCPWCFIGKRRLERALATRDDIEASVNWRVFQLNPDMPPEGMSNDRYLAGKFGNPDRAANAYSMIGRAGHGERIPFNLEAIDRMPNTVQSHRLIRYAGQFGMQTPIVEGIFQAFFLDGEDIGSTLTLTRIGVQVGLDRAEVTEFLNGDEDRDTVLAEEMRARQMGTKAVPCFVINGEYSISGAQEPEAFYPLFDLAKVPLAAEKTSGGVSLAGNFRKFAHQSA